MHRFAPLSLLVAGLGSAVALGGLAVAGQVSTQNGKRCPTATFPNLAGASGAGASYAKPRVKATCSNTQLIVTSSGMIGYRFVPKTPNALTEQDWKLDSDAYSKGRHQGRCRSLVESVPGRPAAGTAHLDRSAVS